MGFLHRTSLSSCYVSICGRQVIVEDFKRGLPQSDASWKIWMGRQAGRQCKEGILLVCEAAGSPRT